VAITMDGNDLTSTVRLAGEVDISGAMELKDRLMEALAAGKEVRLELSGATALDITAIQLVLAVERAAKMAGVAFGIEGSVPGPLALTMVEAGLPPLTEIVQ
jgi:ABC-type transporter Mla MlaB component